MIRGNTSFFITGGTLGQDTPSYVERQADAELYEGLRQGEFCYVLTARQMGKSSLMVRTANRLREDGFSVATLDLTMVGQNLTLEQWYYGLLNLAGRQLSLRAELRAFWGAHPELGPLQRFMQALEQVVLASLDPSPDEDETRPSRGLVIFVDEIDSVLSLPFNSDELFAAIRQCYNRRAEEPPLRRLTFCLLGVTSPSQLIRDVRTTPFNVGRRIELHDFREAEAQPLAVGLQLGTAGDPLRPPRLAQHLLRRVLHWTAGHPYLTQRLCREVAESPKVRDARGVDRLCRDLFLLPGARSRDDNLLFVQERLVNREDDVAAYLDLYRRIRSGQRVRCDETDPRVPELRLSGIVREERGHLRVRNRIYHRVFDPAWIDARMPDAELRRQRAAYQQGLRRSAAIASAVVAVTGGLAAWGTWSSYRARKSEASAKRLANERGAALEQTNQLFYVGNIKSAWQAVELHNYEQASEFLRSLLPKSGQKDLRSWEWYYLWSICHPEQLAIRDHSRAVRFLSLATTGKTLVSAGMDHTVMGRTLPGDQTRIIYQPTPGEERRGIQLTPDGKTLVRLVRPASKATYPGDGNWQLHYADTTAHVERILFTGLISPSQFSLATSGTAVALIAGPPERRTVRWWSLESSQSTELHGIVSHPTALALSSDGQLAAIGTRSGEVIIWDISRRRPLYRQTCSTEGVLRVYFTAGNATLTVLAGDLFRVDISSRRLTRLSNVPRMTTTATAVSPDGHLFAAGISTSSRLDAPSKIIVWDLLQHKLLREITGHTGPITALSLSNDHRNLASAGWDRTVRVWNLKTSSVPRSIRINPNRIYGVAALSAPATVAARLQGSVRILDLRNGSPPVDLPAEGFDPLATCPLTGSLATITNKSVTVWKSGPEYQSFRLPHLKTVTGLSFSGDGKLLATTDTSSDLRIWDLEARVIHRLIPGCSPAAFQPHSQLLARKSSRLLLLEEPSSTPSKSFPVPPYVSYPLMFSPDGSLLAMRSQSAILLRDIAAGQETIISSHQHGIRSIAFTPDSRTLATAGLDQTIHLWNLATGAELAVLQGGPIGNYLTFTSDGIDLISGGRDGLLRVWSAYRPKEMASLSRPSFN